ncbi:MAG: GTPase RsgA [bacterium]|nr:GTPase RsgA [bacterium]
MLSRRESWKRVLRVVRRADVVVEVLDARAPDESRIPRLEELVEANQKQLILAINKVDLVPYSYIKYYYKQFSREYPTVLLSVKNRWGSKKLRRKILECTEKRPVVVGIVGYPNVGKSSIINMLRGRRVAAVSSRPGFTRGEQLVKVSSNIYIYDTPGVIIPESPEKLALLGAYPIEKLREPEKVAEKILEKIPKELLLQVYGSSTLDELASKWNMTREAAARKVLQDWYRGRLGLDFQRAAAWKKIRALFHPARHDIEQLLLDYKGPLLAREIYYYLLPRVPSNLAEIIAYVQLGDYIVAVLVKPRFLLEMKKWLEQELEKLGKYSKVEEFGDKQKFIVLVYKKAGAW